MVDRKDIYMSKHFEPEFHLISLRWIWFSFCLNFLNQRYLEFILGDKSHSSWMKWRFKFSLRSVLHSSFVQSTASFHLWGKVHWTEKKESHSGSWPDSLKKHFFKSSLSSPRLRLFWLCPVILLHFFVFLLKKMVYHRVHVSHKKDKL